MTEEPQFKEGDRVRVRAFEGVITYTNNDDRFDVQPDGDELPQVEYVSTRLMEKLRPSLAPGVRVGRNGVYALHELPPGTVIAQNGPGGQLRMKCDDGTWVSANEYWNNRPRNHSAFSSERLNGFPHVVRFVP